ncbi:MAG TPA: hypothetical protein PKC29_13960 [Thermodesulfobacteriota bacterium]|nr:hypothetical protein [Thermodesulfobacteriota bacterium]
MVKKFNFGFRMFFSAAAVIALAGAFMLSSCSSEKKDEVEVEETVETESVMEAATPAPAPEAGMEEDTSSDGYGGTMEAQPTTGPRMRVEGQVPPELAEPCMAKNTGDECTVIITGGRQIDGQCTETRKGQLACMPKPKPGKGARPQ